MQIVMVLAVLTTFIGLFIHAGREIFILLRFVFKDLNFVIYGIVYAILTVLIIVNFITSRFSTLGIPRVIFTIGHYALGILIYLVIFINLFAFIVFIGKITRLIPINMYGNIKLLAGLISVVLTLTLSLYGFIHAGNIQIKEYRIQMNSNIEMDDLNVVLISDLHMGYIIDDMRVSQIMNKVNNLKPDIVLIAGDIFDGDVNSLSDQEKIQNLFQKIKSKYGTYASLGNHDAGPSYEEMIDFLKKSNIVLLNDEAVVIDKRFALLGRKDSSPIGNQGDKRVSLDEIDVDYSLPLIVLDHQPSNIDEYKTIPCLVLAGHSHKGQFFPFDLVTNATFKVDYGLYQEPANDSQVIVTSGVGTWGPPMRVATNSEIVNIKISFSKIEN